MTVSNNDMCFDILVTSIGNTSISLFVNLPWLISIKCTKHIFNKLMIKKNNNKYQYNDFGLDIIYLYFLQTKQF